MPPQGKWVHAVAEDGQLYSFEVAEGKLKHTLQAHDPSAMIIGAAVHPHRNLVATWSDDSTLRLWR